MYGNIDGHPLRAMLPEVLVFNIEGFNVLVIGDREKPETIAHNLFDAFRKCDEMRASVIVLEGIEEVGIGLAVMNRAHRAANK